MGTSYKGHIADQTAQDSAQRQQQQQLTFGLDQKRLHLLAHVVCSLAGLPGHLSLTVDHVARLGSLDGLHHPQHHGAWC